MMVNHHTVAAAATTMTSTSTSTGISIDTSNHVYIRSAEHSWIPARLLERHDESSTATVSIPMFKDEPAIQSGSKAAKRHEKQVVDLKDYPNRAFPLQNVDEHGNLKEVDDMVDLPFLHEAAILYNLKSRHIRALPYTRTGDIIIACNPYKWYTTLYTESTRSQYATALVYDPPDHVDPRANLAPHVYETSSLAYRGLAVEGEAQSILVSGESGAGKTETVKILLSDLASVQRGLGRHKSSSATTNAQAAATEESPIVQRVLDSNPLLEAFGNAKTVRNDNSSRFGKYIQLQFDAEDAVSAAYAGKCVPSCLLAGSKCEVYLLEKSRVVSHEEEERTYHIFYQLLAADDSVKTSFWQGLENTDNESFSYVGFTETESIEGKSDAERFRHTCESLALVGIQDGRLKTLMRAICIVLQLGNLVFEPDETDPDKSIITSTEDLSALSDLLGVSEEELLPALTYRTITAARNESFPVPLNATHAKDSCDAFAKEIYDKTFLWLVRAINAATCAEQNYEGGKKKNYGIIGMLDIFGFEVFQTNRFEQLCINYANEKLQQKFTQDIFRSVQAEYENEGIELGEITYDDNSDVLDLVEGRMGMLAFLNEECVRPGGNDKSYVSKAKTMNKESPCFYTQAHFSEFQFGIIHYAGKVVYDAQNFVTKNTDTLPVDFLDLAAKCSNDILKFELADASVLDAPSPATANKKAPRKPAPKKAAAPNPKTAPQKKSSSMVQGTVWTKFRNQLEALMETLKKTRTRYIRCIKPNTLKEPLLMQHNSTVEQLRCAGVVAAVTISRSAFPNRLELIVVLDRFRALWPKGEHLHALAASDDGSDYDDLDPDVQNAKLVGQLLTKALKEIEVTREDGTVMKAFVIGRTRVYFRAGALEFMEAERVRALGIWAVEIQKIGREFLCRRRYRKLRWLALRLAAFERMRRKRVAFLRLRGSTILVQCFYRIILAVRCRIELNRNHKVTRIQTRWRVSRDMSVFKKKRSAAIVIETVMRGALQRPKYRQALHDKKEEAKLENQVVALQRKLEEAEKRRLDTERMAEERARKAVEQYKEEKEASVSELGSVPATFEIVEEEKDGDSFQSAVESQQQHRQQEEQQQISEQQQRLMDESGKMLEYLRTEVFKLRSQNAQMRTDFDLLKDNNKRLMDANASAGASFAALNQHAKQLSKTNEKLQTELATCKSTLQKVSVTQVELKEELKMKQATYVAEVHSRLQYQKALSSIVDLVQESCRDTRMVESILGIADSCEAEYMSGPTGLSPSRKLFATPAAGIKPSSGENSGLMSSIRNLWA